jgi:hypothetical protein
MTAPDANNTGIDPDFDARFSHLTVSTAQMDGTPQDATTSSFWPNQDASFSSQVSTTGFGTVDPPPLADTVSVAPINIQQHSLDYGQYPEHSTDQAYWVPDNNPAQPGPSFDSSAADSPLVCPWEGCTNEYGRQCDLEWVSFHLSPR